MMEKKKVEKYIFMKKNKNNSTHTDVHNDKHEWNSSPYYAYVDISI